MPRKTDPEKEEETCDEVVAVLGRPRRYTNDALVDAALHVMQQEGYAALTIRSLARQLGTSHSTLYNYVDKVDEIEAQALLRLTARLPLPQSSLKQELRAELLAYLKAVARLLSQHPGVLFPPIKSAAWNTLENIGERWIEALSPHAPDEKTTRLALGGLVSIVVVHAERDRAYGKVLGKTGRGRSTKVPAGLETLTGVLDAMTDLVLPGLRS